ncbi:MAG: hypothetical protein A2491_21465 [Bacteroidetes bacterium RIFOXYC12_FULL_35_7]|nr:MAG: hypothetical protein A2491_21465 [Bacteroidetes bacterium RIFOXYC12_FULL_35_7]
MQNQFVITIDNRVSPDFVMNFLKSINFVKSIEPKKNKRNPKTDIDEVTLLSENTLSEEWLSDEDNRWDKVL